MTIQRHKQFLRNYRKRILPYSKLANQFEERLKLFLQNPQNPILKDHELKGKKKAFRAFSITGNIRVIYKIEDYVIRLYDIGSHNQVY